MKKCVKKNCKVVVRVRGSRRTEEVREWENTVSVILSDKLHGDGDLTVNELKNLRADNLSPWESPFAHPKTNLRYTKYNPETPRELPIEKKMRDDGKSFVTAGDILQKLQDREEDAKLSHLRGHYKSEIISQVSAKPRMTEEESFLDSVALIIDKKNIKHVFDLPRYCYNQERKICLLQQKFPELFVGSPEWKEGEIPRESTLYSEAYPGEEDPFK